MESCLLIYESALSVLKIRKIIKTQPGESTDVTTQMMLMSDIQQNQRRLAELRERIEIELKDNETQLHKKLQENGEQQVLQEQLVGENR